MPTDFQLPLSERNLDFNVIIEGSFYKCWSRHYYKFLALNVPQNATFVSDSQYKFHLCGKTRDFKGLIGIPDISVSEYSLNTPLSLHAGLVIPSNCQDDTYLERPRSIFTRDGRIYINFGILEEDWYVSRLPQMLREMGTRFNSPYLAKVVQRHFKRRI